MAKIGYVMVAEHYERLEKDRSWMNEYGCVQIIEERKSKNVVEIEGIYTE